MSLRSGATFPLRPMWLRTWSRVRQHQTELRCYLPNEKSELNRVREASDPTKAMNQLGAALHPTDDGACFVSWSVFFLFLRKSLNPSLALRLGCCLRESFASPFRNRWEDIIYGDRYRSSSLVRYQRAAFHNIIWGGAVYETRSGEVLCEFKLSSN